GCVSWLSAIRSPLACITSTRRAFSASEPSHQWMASGWVSLATEATQSLRAGRWLDIRRAPVGAGGGKAGKRRPTSASAGNQRRHDMADVGFEFVMVQARLAQLQGQLQEADVGGVGQAGAVLRVQAAQAGLAETGGQVVQAPLRNPVQHRLHHRVVERLEQFAVDDVRLELVRDQLEQRLQAGARLGDGLELAEHGFLLHRLPALQGRHQQGLARREMPVETSLGDAQAAGQRFDRHRRQALLGDDVQGGDRPVFGLEAGRALGLGSGCDHTVPECKGWKGAMKPPVEPNVAPYGSVLTAWPGTDDTRAYG